MVADQKDPPPPPVKRGRRPKPEDIDAEARAITGCHAALEKLDKEAANRVIDYVKARLGLDRGA